MSQAPVLVGTDLNDSAAEAIRQAGAWALRTAAPLVVVHVAPGEVLRALEEPKVTRSLRERTASILGEGAPEVEVLVVAGSTHGGIVRVADERGAALVVVGAPDAEAAHGLFGTAAEQVVRYAHCPVLVARPSPKDGVVLVATDFSDEATTAIDAAAAEARRRAVPLRLVHSLHEPSTSLSLLGPMIISLPEMPESEREELRSAAGATLRSLLEASRVPGACEVLDGPPATSIPKEATALSAGLVVVATRGRTGLSRIALGSVAEAIARHSPCSVLAVRRGPGHPE